MSHGKRNSEFFAARDRLIHEHSEWVSGVARQVNGSLSMPFANLDELISAGYLGLVEAAERYEPARGKDFRAYAYQRIRGAILDSVRSHSRLSVRAHQRMLELQENCDGVREDYAMARPRRASKPRRLARLLNEGSRAAVAYRLNYLLGRCPEDMLGESIDPERSLERRQEAELLRGLVAELPVKERRVVEDYYFKGVPFTEIAVEGCGHSKSWISKLHKRAMDRLKEGYLLRNPEL